MNPLLIASSPTGAYKGRADHATLPLSADEIAITAAGVHAAGARMLHLHVREDDETHSLDPNRYADAVSRVRARLGPDLFIQLTSESGGIYSPEEQGHAVMAMASDGVSLALKELVADDSRRDAARDLFREVRARGMLAQYIVFSAEEVVRYQELVAAGVIPPDEHSLLLVLGRYGKQPSTPAILHDMLEQLESPVSWMVCAFGEREFECLLEAVMLGGHVRIGFENSLRLADGEIARDNRQLIEQMVNASERTPRPLADIEDTWRILGSRSATDRETA